MAIHPTEPEDRTWLLLIHQLPAKPAYLRVKIWRRLQALGAVAVKNAVYALPTGEQAQEDFAWLLREIAEGGGEAFVCEARLAGGLSDEEIRALFMRARGADYAALAEEARALMADLAGDPSAETRVDARTRLARLGAKLAQVAAIDFFGADGRETVNGLLEALEARMGEGVPGPGVTPQEAAPLEGLQRRTWVTRQGVHVDRIASAWLIRRFIDPEARFKFVPPRGYRPEPGELRFDMFEAELTHEGERCTFEVLLARAGLDDPALGALAEIVHDLDLKDGRFGRPEAEGIGALVAGLCLSTESDEERLLRGAGIFEDLYGYFRKKRP
jgi:hypothetical protein